MLKESRKPEISMTLQIPHANRCRTNLTEAGGLPNIAAAVAYCRGASQANVCAAGHLCCIRRDEEEVQRRQAAQTICSV